MQGQVLGCKSLIKLQWHLQHPSRALGHVSDPMLWVHDEGGYEKRGRKHYDEDQAPKISFDNATYEGKDIGVSRTRYKKKRKKTNKKRQEKQNSSQATTVETQPCSF